MTEREALPAEAEAVALLVVWWLAALAGAVDACGIAVLNDLYVSFMSGNTTSLGVAIGVGDWARVRLICFIIACFVGGAAAGAMIAGAAGRRRLPVVVAIVGILLAVPLSVPGTLVAAMTFAMGVLNAAIQQAGRVSVSLTFVTGGLVRLGQGLGTMLSARMRGEPVQGWAWLEQCVPWTGMLAGAVAGTLGWHRLGAGSFAVLPAVALVIAAVTWPLTAPRPRDRPRA